MVTIPVAGAFRATRSPSPARAAMRREQAGIKAVSPPSARSRQGRRLDDLDLVIAATAITIGYRLARNNDRYFAPNEGLHLENWSQPLC